MKRALQGHLEAGNVGVEGGKPAEELELAERGGQQRLRLRALNAPSDATGAQVFTAKPLAPQSEPLQLC